MTSSLLLVSMLSAPNEIHWKETNKICWYIHDMVQLVYSILMGIPYVGFFYRLWKDLLPWWLEVYYKLFIQPWFHTHHLFLQETKCPFYFIIEAKYRASIYAIQRVIWLRPILSMFGSNNIILSLSGAVARVSFDFIKR